LIKAVHFRQKMLITHNQDTISWCLKRSGNGEKFPEINVTAIQAR
jgi:hypothetical protein